MLIYVVKNEVIWLNAFPQQDGVSSEHSPCYFLTGYELSYDAHAILEFRAYVQTHEEHSNNMTHQILGTIAELLVKVDESYASTVTYDHGKPVIYTELDKALYGTLQVTLLFWKCLSAFFSEHGFVTHSYDPCVMNKTIQGMLHGGVACE